MKGWKVVVGVTDNGTRTLNIEATSKALDQLSRALDGTEWQARGMRLVRAIQEHDAAFFRRVASHLGASLDLEVKGDKPS